MVNKNFKKILNQKATVKKKNGVSYGKPSYEEDGTEIDIYWERNNTIVIDGEGREITSQGLGLVLPDIDIEVGDLIIDPFGSEWEVLDLKSTPDILNKKDVHHKEVYV